MFRWAAGGFDGSVYSMDEPMSTQDSAQDDEKQRQLIQSICELVAEKLQFGIAPKKIQELLQEKGLDPELAEAIVSKVSAMHRQAKREAANKNMLYGALWCIGGTVVTVASFSAASGGGRYVVAWGAIVFGGIQFFRGLSQLAD
jgi:hypothetical protein